MTTRFRLDNAGNVYETDEWIWEQYSLFLIINRHVCDSMDDADVSHALCNVRKTIPLPFFDDRRLPDGNESL